MINPYIKISLVIIVVILLISLLNFYMAVHPTRFKTGIAPNEVNLKYENITFRTSDNILIKGWFIHSKKKTDKTIIVCHGYPFDKNNILQGVYFLGEKFNLLLFDFRYFGESQGRYTTLGYKEKKDFLAAVNFLKQKNITKIGALGFSLGAATILMTNSKDVKAIVADSSYATIDKMIERTYFIFPSFTKMPFVFLTKLYAKIFLDLNSKDIAPVDDITKIKVPILLIHGEKDSQISVENSKILYEASNKDKTELWIVPKSDHGYAHYLYPEEYEQKLFEFFEKNLK